jgi:hypothetical protein
VDQRLSSTSLFELPPPSFATKDERLERMDQVGFFVANVVLGRDVMTHFGVEEPLALSVRLNTSSTVHQAIGAILDHYLNLRSVARGQSTASLCSQSPFLRIARGLVAADPAGSVALLQSLLSLSTTDAAGKVLKQLKRVVALRGGGTSNAAAARSAAAAAAAAAGNPQTVSEIATALILRDCSRTPDQTLSQKTLISVLSKDDPDFAPPILFQVGFSERARRIVLLSTKEAVTRDAIEAESAKFMLLFARPYLSELLNPDTSLRSDWVVYEGLCRHKITILERQGRGESARRTVVHQEEEFRAGLLVCEECDLRATVLSEEERIGLIAIAAAGRAAIEAAQSAAWNRICQMHGEGVRDIGLVRGMLVETFVVEAAETCDLYWLQMLRVFDRAVGSTIVLPKKMA